MLRYVEIYRTLKREIKEGRYKPDDKLPSVLELMAAFKAGCCTVQHALNMLEKEGVIQGVPSQGLFVRDPGEPPLYGGKTRKKQMLRIGVLLRRPVLLVIAETHYIQKMVHGMGTVLYEAGMHGFPIDVFHKTNHEVIREINALAIDGLICVEMEDEGLVRGIKQMKLPLVHCELVGFKSKDPMVLADHFHGGELSVRQLAKFCHTNVLFLHGHKKSERKTDETNRLTWQGIQAGVRACGVSAHQAFISMDTENICALVVQALRKHQKCMGFIACNQSILEGLRQAFETGALPGSAETDIVVFDLNDESLMVRGRPVWFCTWDAEKMGKMAAHALVGKVKPEPRVQFIPMTLVTNAQQ